MKLLAKHSDTFDPARPWLTVGIEEEHRTKLFTLRHARCRSPHTGRESVFTRLLCPEWVNVIAVTRDGELLAVEQFRHGHQEPSLEIVGGVCDPGEEPLESARRELLEETGHLADEIVSLGFSHPNPAIQDNRCHFFLALGCHPVAELDLDPSEELRVWSLNWDEMEGRLRSGEISHALVLNAFYRLTLWEGWEELRGKLKRG